MKYEFEIVIGGNPEVTDELIDSLYEAGCGDSLVGSCDGITRISFGREAESLEQAIRGAIANIQSAGLAAKAVEMPGDAEIFMVQSPSPSR